jgi:hypothetical protein
MLSVCLCIPPMNFRLAESVFMKRGIYIMAPEPISTVYFINPSHQSFCLYVYSLSLLGNCLVKISLSLLGNGSVKTLPRQRIRTQQKNNCWTRRFLCGPYRIKESRRLVFFCRNSCYLILLIRAILWCSYPFSPVFWLNSLFHITTDLRITEPEE